LAALELKYDAVEFVAAPEPKGAGCQLRKKSTARYTCAVTVNHESDLASIRGFCIYQPRAAFPDLCGQRRGLYGCKRSGVCRFL